MLLSIHRYFISIIVTSLMHFYYIKKCFTFTELFLNHLYTVINIIVLLWNYLLDRLLFIFYD